MVEDLQVTKTSLTRLDEGPTYRGTIDFFADLKLVGWCLRAADPEDPVWLRLLLNDRKIGEISTGFPRADIKKIIGRESNNGFIFDLVQLGRDDPGGALVALREVRDAAPSDEIEVQVHVRDEPVRLAPGRRLKFTIAQLTEVLEQIGEIEIPSPPPAEYLAVASLPSVSADRADDGGVNEFPLIPTPAGVPGQSVGTSAGGGTAPPRTTILCNGLDVFRSGSDADVGGSLAILDIFARLNGLNAEEIYAVSTSVGGDVLAWPETGRDGALFDPHLLAGDRRLRDIWFNSDLSLCLAFGDGEDLPSVEGAIVRAYQFTESSEPELQRLVDCELAGTGGFVEAPLVTPWRPVLLTVSDAVDRPLALGVLAFPSLARGGLHHAEYVALSDGPASMAQLAKYMEARAAEWLEGESFRSTIAVRLSGATGAEIIFQPSVRNWLGRLGWRMTAIPAEDSFDADRLLTIGLPQAEPSGEMDIVLPADALPTIALLTGAAGAPQGGEDRRLGPAPFLVAEAVAGRPRWSISVPRDPALMALQPEAANDLPATVDLGQVVAPVCIRYPSTTIAERASSQFFALPLATRPLANTIVADDQARTTCVLDVSNLAQADRFLNSLQTQQGADDLRVVIRLAPQLEAQVDALRVILDRFQAFREPDIVLADGLAVRSDWLLEISEGASSILLARDSLILHDHRLLETLQKLIALPRVASVAPVVLHESVEAKATRLTFSEAGYFPTRVSLAGGPRLVMSSQMGAVTALPAAVFPVMANTDSLVLLSRGAVEEVDLPRVSPGAFGLAALRKGYHHLCVSAVRATTTRRPPSAEIMDPIGARAIPPGEWFELLSRVTLVEDIR